MDQPNIPSLLHLGGDARGKRKALIIHGIRSEAEDMQPIAEALLQAGTCDAAWAYDSWSYFGAIKNLKRGIRSESHAVHGAAQEVTSLLSLLGWKDVTLVGHSLGGIVARCAAEFYDAHKHLKILVTLGSPHALWLNTHRHLDWEPIPPPKVRYLQIVGNGDAVVFQKGYGNLSFDDESFPNLVKVLYPGLDHRSIRRLMAETYIPELITAVRDTKSLFHKRDLLLTNTEQKNPVLSIRRDDFENRPELNRKLLIVQKAIQTSAKNSASLEKRHPFITNKSTQ